jgi:hypothetical protein
VVEGASSLTRATRAEIRFNPDTAALAGLQFGASTLAALAEGLAELGELVVGQLALFAVVKRGMPERHQSTMARELEHRNGETYVRK